MRVNGLTAAWLVTIASMIALSAPETAEAAAAPAGRIVFSSFDNASTSDIYSISPDGSGLKNLTSTPGDYEQVPSISRDGTKIVFRRGFDPVSAMELYTMNADGSGVARVTNNAFAEDFESWTPADHLFRKSAQRGYELPVSALQLGPLHRAGRRHASATTNFQSRPGALREGLS